MRLHETPPPVRLGLPLAGLAAVVLVLRGRHRPAAFLLAAAFVATAWLYQFRLYAELTPAGTVFGWLFLALLPVRFLWCAVNAATLHVLEATVFAGVLLGAALPALAGAVIEAVVTYDRQV